jgi:rRNA-processing protein FCF1
MANNTKILFTDTNAFLQLRDLKDLPWGDFFANVQAVDVMVASCVIEELDNHKTGTNQRRRDRARLA